MSYKIATASSNGQQVDRHFGHAGTFYITEVLDDGTYFFLEKRIVESPCRHGKHDSRIMQKVIEKIADCKYVLCEAVGSGAAAILAQKHITPLETDNMINKAIGCIILYDKRLQHLL
ncbi:NifB/NifX family molybdenum-iron cluster-binding protein [Pectinatus frisingensis]|uniref:NifB/NifX family molybdenum-iron cluster-binding protein n=1 Tax=Pectinatus frisingensis TaxID=865 RepID=UPI0018C6BBBE|nr:NifB/NifX family molybdenum-iron cluster-binding protein [Pectinatus frisingensis]